MSGDSVIKSLALPDQLWASAAGIARCWAGCLVRLSRILPAIVAMGVWLWLWPSKAETAVLRQSHRLAHVAEALTPLAQQLAAAWPESDGKLEGGGAFMAYPIGKPRTLIMLELPVLGALPVSFAVVEGRPGGPIRFELTGLESGHWLEWHPPETRPRSFVGGLFELHRLEHFEPVGNGWYLVRYRPPGNAKPRETVALDFETADVGLKRAKSHLSSGPWPGGAAATCRRPYNARSQHEPL